MAGRNRYANPFANMRNAGGNHQAQTIQGILQEGRKSYQGTMDRALGTNKAIDPNLKIVKPITPKR